MTTVLLKRKRTALRLVVLLVGRLAVHSTAALGQTPPERFWLAGRYDGNRVVVYFDAVKFKGTMLSNSSKIANPLAEAFFEPVELPASYIAGFQKAPNAEHFAVGDRYDVLLGNGIVATVRLTTLVGCETDEQVGNDSFIGALGTVEKKDILLFTKGYYALRRHQEPPSGAATPRPKTRAEYLKHAQLVDGFVRFGVQSRIATLLNGRLKMEASDAVRRRAELAPLAFSVQPFSVADGSLRYYVRAEWKSGREKQGRPSYALAAWIAPLPTLHITAIESLNIALMEVNFPNCSMLLISAKGKPES